VSGTERIHRPTIWKKTNISSILKANIMLICLAYSCSHKLLLTGLNNTRKGTTNQPHPTVKGSGARMLSSLSLFSQSLLALLGEQLSCWPFQRRRRNSTPQRGHPSFFLLCPALHCSRCSSTTSRRAWAERKLFPFAHPHLRCVCGTVITGLGQLDLPEAQCPKPNQ
jgi:hypothetical protein